MVRRLLLFCMLFAVHYQLAECGKYSGYNLEKLFKLGLKSLDKATDIMDRAVDNPADGTADDSSNDDDDYYYDLNDLPNSAKIESKSKKSGIKKTSNGTSSAAASLTANNPPTNKTVTDKPHVNKTFTGKPHTNKILTGKPPANKTVASKSPSSKFTTKFPILSFRPGLKLTQKPNKHQRKRDVSEKPTTTVENLPLRMREQTILLEIKTEADKIERSLELILGSMLNKHGTATLSNGMSTTKVTPATSVSLKTTVSPQTTDEPYPEAYQGFNPIINTTHSSYNNNNSGKRRPGGTSIRRKRSLKMKHKNDDSSWRSKLKNYKRHHHHHHHHKHHRPHHPKRKLLVSRKKSLPNILKLANGARTKGLQMTVLKSSKCSKSGPVMTDVLKTVWTMEKMIRKLGRMINRDVKQLGNKGVDSTNEERADIKANSDRISQMQKGLSGKIDDIRYNISTLITSQRELGRSVSVSLESMMGILNQMVTMVTKKNAEIENRMKVEEKSAQSKPDTKNNITTAHGNGNNVTNYVNDAKYTRLVTKLPRSKSKLEDAFRHDGLATKPKPNETGPVTTQQARPVTTSPNIRIKSENAVEPGENPVLTLDDAKIITNHVRPTQQQKQSKKVKTAEKYQQKSEEQNQMLKGRKPLGWRKPLGRRKPLGKVRKPFGKFRKQFGKVRKPNGRRKPFSMGKSLGKVRKPLGKVRKPNKKLKSGTRYRKIKAGHRHKLQKGGKKRPTAGDPLKTVKDRKHHDRPTVGKLYKSKKYRRPHDRPTVGNPHTMPKGGRARGKPTTEYTRNILKGGSPREKLTVKNLQQMLTDGKRFRKSGHRYGITNGGRPRWMSKISKAHQLPKEERINVRRNVGKSHTMFQRGRQRRNSNDGKSHKVTKSEEHGKPNVAKHQETPNGGKTTASPATKVPQNNTRSENASLATNTKNKENTTSHVKIKEPEKSTENTTTEPPRVWEPQKQLKSDKPQEKPRFGILHKIMEKFKSLKGGKSQEKQHSEKPQKDGKPQGKRKVGKRSKNLKDEKPPTVKGGKQYKKSKTKFHNDHAILNKFKNSIYSKSRKKHLKKKGHQGFGITSKRRHKTVFNNYQRKQRQRHFKKDKTL